MFCHLPTLGCLAFSKSCTPFRANHAFICGAQGVYGDPYCLDIFSRSCLHVNTAETHSDPRILNCLLVRNVRPSPALASCEWNNIHSCIVLTQTTFPPVKVVTSCIIRLTAQKQCKNVPSKAGCYNVLLMRA